VRQIKKKILRRRLVSNHTKFFFLGSGGDEDCVKSRNIVEKKMSPSQIEKAQEMAKNWKPKK
jgi:hypothetical protein